MCEAVGRQGRPARHKVDAPAEVRILKALSLWQPWATLVVHGIKRWETRPWRVGGTLPLRLAIHASAATPRDAAQMALQEPFQRALARLGLDPGDLPAGAIVGVVSVMECLPTSEVRDLLTGDERALGDFGPGRWAWRLDEAFALPNPVRCKGALGLWDLGWEIERAVLVQLDERSGHSGK